MAVEDDGLGFDGLIDEYGGRCDGGLAMVIDIG